MIFVNFISLQKEMLGFIIPEDIENIYYEREKKYVDKNPYKIKYNYDIKNCRKTVIDWVIDVCVECNIYTSGFLAISVFDRLITQKVINQKYLQKYAISSILIASKYEELNYLHPRDCSILTDGGVTLKDILLAEKELLDSIDHRLSVATPIYFFDECYELIDRKESINRQDIESKVYYIICQYYIEHNFLESLPSKITKSAYKLVCKLLDININLSGNDIIMNNMENYVLKQKKHCLTARDNIRSCLCDIIKKKRAKKEKENESMYDISNDLIHMIEMSLTI